MRGAEGVLHAWEVESIVVSAPLALCQVKESGILVLLSLVCIVLESLSLGFFDLSNGLNHGAILGGLWWK